jgi:EAL domain-containing protein (putative c-di-GMP-specific phosphodiesterase class I)/ActR/RegA family two-component response regulator
VNAGPNSRDTEKAVDASPEAAEEPRPRLLLLDDDPFALGLQTRMLRDLGYTQLSTTASGEAALLLLGQPGHGIDVILCDLNMPGIDGIEFLQTLKAGGFEGGVILLSGEGSRILHTVQTLLNGSGLAVLGSLEKPASRSALSAMMRRWRPNVAPTARPCPPTCTPAEVHAANRAGQWLLHYQPKVDLARGALVGVEALIRWNHPTHGLVFPDHFIGVAEACGAIDTMTEWVLREALRQVVCWQHEGLALQVSVNVSMQSLGSPGFARRVRDLVAEIGAAPQDLMLEITESRLMAETAVPLECLARLRMQRFGLSIDDFGTGHSSLSQLRDVPFTELKVDRGFVTGARYDQIIRPILEGSIGIAKRMGIQVVAEGIETEDDWHLLREIGCDFGQGWFIGRPMSSDRLPAWLYDWESRRMLLVGA